MLSQLFQSSGQDQKNIDILCQAFASNQRMQVLIKAQGKRFSFLLRLLMTYCYLIVRKLEGVFISKNQATILLYYQKSKHFFSFQDGLRYLYIAIFVIGWNRLWRVLKREKLIKKIRQAAIEKHQDQDYLYVWFLAQKKDHEGLRDLVEAKKHLFAQASRQNLPIYMETTEERLVPIYQRMGFEFYEFKEEKKTGLIIWFGRCGLPDSADILKLKKHSQSHSKMNPKSRKSRPIPALLGGT